MTENADNKTFKSIHWLNKLGDPWHSNHLFCWLKNFSTTKPSTG